MLTHSPRVMFNGLIVTAVMLAACTALAEPVTSPRCNQFTFDASASYHPADKSLSYLWDFGDGQTSRQPAVEHTYEKSGDYAVTLSVTGQGHSGCNTAVTSQVVRVNIPPHASFRGPEQACVNEPVIFDASGSYDDSGRELKFAWDFGDGTDAAGPKRATKVYTKGGNYKVVLNVDDNSATDCSSKTAEKMINVNEPPAADAGSEVIHKCIQTEVFEDPGMTVVFDASASRDANDDPLSYFWDFGDGTSDQGVRVSHRYAQLGYYDVKLIVKDGTRSGCGTDVDFVSVKFDQAPRAEAGDEVSVCVGEQVVFDGTNSYVHTKGTLSAQWDFGDGQTADTLKATHRYQEAGRYEAALTVKNQLNPACAPSRDTRLVKVNSQPTVKITAADSGCVGETIHFETSGYDTDGDPLEYYWSFGDGSITKGGTHVSHRYAHGGDYRVSVIVDDEQKTACSTATAQVNVHINTPPLADAGANLSCCTGKKTAFDASASLDPDGDRLTYRWDFGDGTKAEGAVVDHTYNQSGSFEVTLTVDDNSGTACSRSTDGFTALVNAPPVPVMTIK